MRPARAYVPPPMVAYEARQMGLLTMEQKRAIERLVGREALLAVTARLPEDRRQEFERSSPFSWCRCSTLNIVLAELAKDQCRDVDQFTAEVVKSSFGVVLRTAWRLLARFSSDETIVQRASVLYERAIDRGRAEAFVRGPGHLVMEVKERPDLTHIDIVSIAAAISAALEIAGRLVRVSHQRIPNGVRYDVRTRASLPPRAP